VTTRFNETRARFSPDGRWVAYTTDESGEPGVYVAPFDERQARARPREGVVDPPAKIRVSAASGTTPRWRADGRELFYIDATTNAVMAAAIERRGTALAVGEVRTLFTIPRRDPTNPATYEVTGDGQRFLITEPVNPSAVAAAPTVVLNWAGLVTQASEGR
jgi:hypothetical protein